MRRRFRKHPSPADALRRAAMRLTDVLDTAPPEKAAGLALKLAALGRALAAEQARADDAMEDPEEAARLRRDFDAEIEHLIGLRAQERAEAMLAARSAPAAPAAPGPPHLLSAAGARPPPSGRAPDGPERRIFNPPSRPCGPSGMDLRPGK